MIAAMSSRTAVPTPPIPPDLPAAAAMMDAVAFAAIDESVDRRGDDMIAFRRHVHSEPEASGAEFATTALVANALRDAGLNPRVMKDHVGVVCDLDIGGTSDHFVALRAELDCVTVNDDKTIDYASTRSGLCHACGHDAHSSIVLTAIQALHEQREILRTLGLRHNIRAIFQSAEETASGAKSMIEQGATDHVAAMLAVHVEPFIEVGEIGLRVGPLTSAAKLFEIHVRGRSGHSARPFQAVDPVQAACSLVDMFYQLGPRSMDNRYPLALTVASVNAGSAFNAIPDHAILRGTLRASRTEDLQLVEQRMWNVIRGVEQASGCQITMEFPQYAPATNNDPRLIDVMTIAARNLLGERGVRGIDVPSLGGEDFAFFQEVVPGAIVRLGAAMAEERDRKPLHSSLFDIDERCLPIGAKFLARSALLTAATFGA
jgi:amidohydrolase